MGGLLIVCDFPVDEFASPGMNVIEYPRGSRSHAAAQSSPNRALQQLEDDIMMLQILDSQ